MKILFSVLILVLTSFVLWGIGKAVRRLARSRKGCWPVTIGVGLAVVVCVGGVLNLAHIAYPPVFWLTILAGFIIALREARRMDLSVVRMVTNEKAARAEVIIAAIAIGATVAFALATQLPPREFNFQDDLQKYFVHPVRILETGTVAGSSLSALGSETLGGQAFLQAFVVSLLPIPYSNGVDAIFGLFVLLLMAAAAGWRRFGWFPGAALGAAMVGILNPLYANISGLYTGAVFMALAALVVADEREDASPVLLGLAYAAMVAIKPTFGLFAVFHFPLSIVAARAQAETSKGALAWTTKVAVWTVAGVAAWFVVYVPTYLLHGELTATAGLSSQDLSDVSLFSPVRLFNGDSVVSYTAVAGLSMLVAVLALAASRLSGGKRDQRRQCLGLFAAAATGAACFLALILYFSLWIGFQTCVRYSVPFLLGSCVIAGLLAPSLSEKMPRAACVTLPALACLAIVASFLPAAADRFEQAKQYGSILEFAGAKTPKYQQYIEASLSDRTRREIEKLQSDVPPGEPMLAWIDTPYFLNFRRNRIVDVDMAGTSTRWAGVPPDVHYFLWQYRGLAVRGMDDYAERMHEPRIGMRDRLIAARSLEFAKRITELANHAEVVAQLDAGDDQYVLFRVPQVASATAH